jgi:hypothetical protein
MVPRMELKQQTAGYRVTEWNNMDPRRKMKQRNVQHVTVELLYKRILKQSITSRKQERTFCCKIKNQIQWLDKIAYRENWNRMGSNAGAEHACQLHNAVQTSKIQGNSFKTSHSRSYSGLWSPCTLTVTALHVTGCKWQSYFNLTRLSSAGPSSGNLHFNKFPLWKPDLH